MECQQARQFLVASLSDDLADRDLAALREHSDACEGCRAELSALRQTWGLLGHWPDAEPAPVVGKRLVRRFRWITFSDSILTARGWTPAVIAGAIGVSLSLGLSLLVPYSVLVSLCQQAFQASDHAGPYLMAGVIYGAPLAFGALIALGRPAAWGFVRSLEATILFLLILTPYVIAQCREFPASLQVAFISGMGIGALFGSGGGAWLRRQLPFARPEPSYD
jgi:hypothetical protein